MAASAARDAELARLSGSELVARLRTTCRIPDYAAAARVLDARDARLAKAEVALAEAKEGLDAGGRELAKAKAGLAEAQKGLDTRGRKIVKVEAALTEAKKGLDARDRKIAKAEAELTEAKKGLKSRDGRLVKVEAALAEAQTELAEAKKGLDARDRELVKVEAALAEAKKVLDSRDRELVKVEAALAEAKGLDSRDRKLARTEAELAEAMKGLEARDARLAEAEAAHAETEEGLKASDARLAEMREDVAISLAQVADVRQKYDELKAVLRSDAARPADAIAAPAPALRGEAAEEKGPVFIDLSSSDDEEGRRRISRKRKLITACSSDDEDDTLTLSQLMKKKRDGAQPGADGEPKSADSVPPLGDYLPEASLVIKKEAVDAAVGGSDEPNVASFVQGRGNVKSREDGEMSRAMPNPQPLGSAVAEANSTGPLGIDLPEASLVIKKEAVDTAVGGSDEPNATNFVQGRGNVISGEDGGMSRAMPNPQPLGSAVAGANSAGPLGIDLPGMSLVIKEEPIEAALGGSDEPNVTNFVQERGNVKSADNSGVSTGMLSERPPGFADITASHKNFSKADLFGVRIAGKEGSLRNDLPKTPVITEVAAFVHGRGSGKSARNGGVSTAPPPGFDARTSLPPPGYGARTSSPPPGFDARNGSQMNLAGDGHGDPRIAGIDYSFAGQEEDILAQVRSPSISAKKIVESARADAVSPKGHTSSALGGNIVLGLEAISKQEKMNGGGHNAKVLPRINAIKEQVRGGMVVRDIVEHDETDGLAPKRNVTPVTNGIEKQRAKLRSYHSREMSDGGQIRTSDKQLGSAGIRDELQSEQTSVEGSLPLAVTENWKHETDIFTSCLENREICMQAVCALYRQKRLMFQPAKEGRGLSKSDAHRATKLVEFLLDGNGQGPLKRTAEELMKHDSTGPTFLDKVVCQLYDQLLDIYKNKEDPYFH